MVEVTIRPVRPGDAERLAAHLRAPDVDEIVAARGHRDLAATVAQSVRVSSLCWAAEFDGQLACLFGMAPIDLLGNRGAPWLLGTPLLDRHPSVLMRHCRDYIGEMLAARSHLLNYVDARNTRSIRWLRRLKFTIHEARPYGAEGRPFHLFELEL